MEVFQGNTQKDSRIRVGCPAHNCGGRCLLIATVREGKIVRLETDDRPDTIAAPQLRACVRGRAYLRRQYHPDRLMYPLKRSPGSKRGEGQFQRISWDEALDTIASQIKGVKEQYGSSALFVPYGTGSYNQINGVDVARRLLNLYGGCLGIYNSYSWGATNLATPTVYGTLVTGNQRQDWLNSRYILMWGWNPAEMRDGTNSDYFIKLARQSGARVVCIDPRHSLSAAGLADEWIPIRPGTDAAMMSAMAFVMLTEGLYDYAFISSHCIGFDASQMPVAEAESYSDYILGKNDGQPKNPEWAEAITSVPASTITRIAREYATIKPGILYQGYGMQRRAYGEQVVRAGCVLAAITGNLGSHGGWASGLALQSPDGGGRWTVFPTGRNPVKAEIPVFLWTEACVRGKSMTTADGVRNVERLDNDIKLIYAVASNCLINQHADVNRTAKILSDETKVEFIAVQDNFLTPSARYADLVLPACTQFETWGVEDGWKYGDEVILQPKLVEPPGECKSDYRICAEIADRLGIGQPFTEGRDEVGWTEFCLDEFRRLRFGELPSLAEFIRLNLGAWSRQVTNPAIAFEDFCRDPAKFPLSTPSGKIEIFSKTLYDLNNESEIPAIPKYIQEWESPFGNPGLSTQEFPLQAIGHHTLHRVHSTHDNNDWLAEAFPQRVFINPLDAEPRGISDGDEVRVFNSRGELILPCRLTVRIIPGVVDIPQGAWYEPDLKGLDHGGNINVLTSSRWTPFAFGSAQHTMMVNIERAPKGSTSRLISGFVSMKPEKNR